MKNFLFALTLGAALATTASAQSTVVSSNTLQVVDQLKTAAVASADPALKSVSTNLTAKAQALTQLLGSQTNAQTQLQAALQSLVAGTNAQSLVWLQKLSKSKLKPEQAQLAKEVRDIGGAYLVQKNLGAIQGSQGEIAKIVTSLQKGDVITALPAVQKVRTNAQLTADQKELLASIADAYAPGSKAASDVLSKGLKGFGFGK